MPHEGDHSYDYRSARVMLPISEADAAVTSLAHILARQMHPLNADAQYARIERLLQSLSPECPEAHRANALYNADQQRRAMKRMGAGRAAAGMPPCLTVCVICWTPTRAAKERPRTPGGPTRRLIWLRMRPDPPFRADATISDSGSFLRA